MVTEERLANVTVLDCREDDGALRDTLRANNRKLFWEDICSELIDNSLEHSGDVCQMTIEWDRNHGGVFRAVDNGNGSDDIQAFFKPGKSVQTGKAIGSSTFGMGLFVCECCMSSPDKPGMLKVATTKGGDSIFVGLRRIDKGSSVEAFPVVANDEARRSYGLGYTGTSITFSKFAKTMPRSEDIERISEKLSTYYSQAIKGGQLKLTLIRNGVETTVEAMPSPQCEELKSASLFIGPHVFEVEWGVTTEDCRDNGCRMIYGGKFFETNAEPCDDYRIGRFYASIRVPRTIGKESMDILKRTIDHESIDDLFDQCRVLFKPELQRSDEICRVGDDEALNHQLASMLSVAIRKPKSVKDGETGDRETREYKGRDPEGHGVEPVNTGRRRKGNHGEIPKDISVYWAKLGADKGLVMYQHESARVTYNIDVPMMQELRHSKNTALIGSIAASQIAKDLEGSKKQKEFDFAVMEFSWIYRTMMERILNSIG